MAKSRFSWKGHESDHRGQNDKEDLAVLRKDGLSASIKHEADGTIEYSISGDEEPVSKWRRMANGS